MYGCEDIGGLPSEVAGYPFVLTISKGKIETADRMTITEQ
jgi:hypothetical protein